MPLSGSCERVGTAREAYWAKRQSEPGQNHLPGVISNPEDRYCPVSPAHQSLCFQPYVSVSSLPGFEHSVARATKTTSRPINQYKACQLSGACRVIKMSLLSPSPWSAHNLLGGGPSGTSLGLVYMMGKWKQRPGEHEQEGRASSAHICSR